MVIQENTRISDIIKANPASIEVIAAINKHFNKLKNPVLRKVLASRVNVRDAANIANVKPEEILQALQKIGFEIHTGTLKAASEKEVCQRDENFDRSEKSINIELGTDVIRMDVRPLLEEGTDPFNAITKQVKGLLPNQKLLVINTFEPIPLINMLKEQGFEYLTTRPEKGEVHTLFFKQGNASGTVVSQSAVHENDVVLFQEKLNTFKDNFRLVDVRDLEMPLPMVAILKELELLNKGQALLVEHKKFPQFLLEELATRGFSLVSKNIDVNHTRLLIYRLNA